MPRKQKIRQGDERPGQICRFLEVVHELKQLLEKFAQALCSSGLNSFNCDADSPKVDSSSGPNAYPPFLDVLHKPKNSLEKLSLPTPQMDGCHACGGWDLERPGGHIA